MLLIKRSVEGKNFHRTGAQYDGALHWKARRNSNGLRFRTQKGQIFFGQYHTKKATVKEERF